MAVTQARKLVPKNLVESFGGLCDDPMYSDVVFLLPVRPGKELDHAALVEMGGTSVTRDASPFASHAAETDETSPQAEPSATGNLTLTASGDQHGGPTVGLTQHGHSKSRFKKVYAIKKILRRSEYFVGMFDSGFSESAIGRAEDDDAEMAVSFNVYNHLSRDSDP